MNKAIYLAFGVNLSGLKEVLGMWASDNKGAKFWMQVVTELKNRGVSDIFIACVDGLKGFPEAIEAVYPQTQVQLCMVHLVRHSHSYTSHKDRKAVADRLKQVYQAPTLEEAEHQLTGFEEAWETIYPVIARSWRQNWARVTPMFSYPLEIRQAIYTTNTIESSNMTLRKVSKNSLADLGLLQTGVLPLQPGRTPTQNSYNVNGARDNSNNFLLDGVANQELEYNGPQIRPSIDALSEFTIQTHLYWAEFGRKAGAIINAAIKSGSGDFHGSLYEFLRNDASDARNFFSPEVPLLRRNQFGGTLGGPVLPKLLHTQNTRVWLSCFVCVFVGLSAFSIMLELC